MFHVDVEQLPILQEKLEKTKADLERLAQEGTSRIRSTQQILDESYQRAYYYERAISDRIDDINREISNLRYRSSSDDETVADRLDSLYREEQECREEYWAAQDATRDARRRSESFARESSSYQLLQRCIVEDYFDTVNKSAVFLEKYRTLVLNSQSVLENQSVESYHKIPNDLPEVPEHIGLKIISRYTGNRETVIDVNNPYRMSGDLDKANQWLNKYSESLPGNESGSEKGVEFSFAEIPASSATEASGLMKLDIQRFADNSDFKIIEDEFRENLKHTPINNGEWTGQRGKSKWIPHDEEAKRILERYGTDGINYVNGFPDFNEFSVLDIFLEDSSLIISDYRQFQICDEALSDYFSDLLDDLAGVDYDGDPLENTAYRKALMEAFKCDESELEGIQDALECKKRPPGYTWHHNETKGCMQLIPTKLHKIAIHRGGGVRWGGRNRNR